MTLEARRNSNGEATVDQVGDVLAKVTLAEIGIVIASAMAVYGNALNIGTFLMILGSAVPGGR